MNLNLIFLALKFLNKFIISCNNKNPKYCVTIILICNLKLNLKRMTVWLLNKRISSKIFRYMRFAKPQWTDFELGKKNSYAIFFHCSYRDHESFKYSSLNIENHYFYFKSQTKISGVTISNELVLSVYLYMPSFYKKTLSRQLFWCAFY